MIKLGVNNKKLLTVLNYRLKFCIVLVQAANKILSQIFYAFKKCFE